MAMEDAAMVRLALTTTDELLALCIIRYGKLVHHCNPEFKSYEKKLTE